MSVLCTVHCAVAHASQKQTSSAPPGALYASACVPVHQCAIHCRGGPIPWASACVTHPLGQGPHPLGQWSRRPLTHGAHPLGQGTAQGMGLPWPMGWVP